MVSKKNAPQELILTGFSRQITTVNRHIFHHSLGKDTRGSRLLFAFLVVLAELVFIACERPTSDLLRAQPSAANSQEFHTTVEAGERGGSRLASSQSDTTKTNEKNGFTVPSPFGPPGNGSLLPIPTDDDIGNDFFDEPFLGSGAPIASALGQCGNSTREFFEECDDGNSVNNDGCNNACGLPFCGNGITEKGEECDDGGFDQGDGCSDFCTYERCGNEQLDFLTPKLFEECDDGNRIAGDGCSPWCTLERCGNDVVDMNEECDDGNNKDGDGCDFCCRFEPLCPARPQSTPADTVSPSEPTHITDDNEA